MDKDLVAIQKEITHRQQHQKYNIGDKVNTSMAGCLGGVILECSDKTFYRVEVRYVTTKPYSTDKVIVKTTGWFVEFALRPFNDSVTKEFTRDGSWKDGLYINSSKKRVEHFHHMKLKGYLDLNPDYQRYLVWTEEQKEDLLTSIFQLKNTGILTIIRDCKMDYEVLDGKQRLSTLFDFMEDKFRYKGKLFSELSLIDRTTVECTQLQYAQIESSKDLTTAEKVELFIDFNTKGTQVSEEHIQELKNKYIKNL